MYKINIKNLTGSKIKSCEISNETRVKNLKFKNYNCYLQKSINVRSVNRFIKTADPDEHFDTELLI